MSVWGMTVLLSARYGSHEVVWYLSAIIWRVFGRLYRVCLVPVVEREDTKHTIRIIDSSHLFFHPARFLLYLP